MPITSEQFCTAEKIGYNPGMVKIRLPKYGVYQSAGGLLWRNDYGEERLAVVHRPKYNDWTLPKGALKKDETWQEAALREVWEETGCQARLGDFAGCTCYQVFNTPKIVLFWHMQLVEDGRLTRLDEVDELVWLSVDEARARLSYVDERKLLNDVHH